MDDNMKIVDFEYCKECKYENRKESEEPCHECLAVAGRRYSHRPERFKAKEKKHGK